MTDTTQLKALRDAAQVERVTQSTQNSDKADILWLAAMQTVALCDRAIASLENEQPPAEQAQQQHTKPVAKILAFNQLRGDTRGRVEWLPYRANEVKALEVGDVLYAAPVPPPDSIPREQHEAALAEARREGLREALELVERDRVSASLKSQDSRDAAWNALAMAADAIRALAEKGGEVG